MNTKKIITIVTGCFILLTAVSCSDWLDIRPKDRVNEDTLFENQEGFLKALNGIYVELVAANAYGENLSVGMVDIMAQYYVVNKDSHKFGAFADYNFNSRKDLIAAVDATWRKMYELIANSNTLLEKCENSNGILNDNYYKIIKGESLALRAMLHFDLLRLYGPIYNDATKDSLAIPYMTNSMNIAQPILTSGQVIDLVITDLKAAEDLLKKVDPILTEGVRHYPSMEDDNTFYYRQYRLNYFAVKALLARTYMWANNRTEAIKQATAVIEGGQQEGAEIFPWVSNSQATATINPDRMFSSEVIFALYKSNRNSMFNKFFTSSLASNARLYIQGNLTAGRLGAANGWYTDKNDYRYKAWAIVPGTAGGTNECYLRKFEGAQAENGIVPYKVWANMMPLIRISEMWLILAECSSDIGESKRCLNKIRQNRFCVDINPTVATLVTDIKNELFREMIGEGQFYFFLKRNSLSLPNGQSAIVTAQIAYNESYYRLPLPESETDPRK